ncbi:alkaline phosphatase PafA [Hymenobacter chitinivorans]|uniref:Type I phosphodiesterase/nucleotide pyrophosphatase n=1 Tax=Hymenobacter chitinivorans DSM 11115 TaxID=1121954 RepID=A0A2M9BSR1_9BACT|nr:alkaline phosphatase PafA [Hymenobacter chitinivorans]PJJ60985.1 type I phosphodiesterase/nucleotide pyrophosphatase [Hymenobacter chitinivorans DSM 11115]
MIRKILLSALLLSSASSSYAQGTAKPKLLVGIMVDQMRADYLPRFYDQMGNDGFKRLLREGFQCRNTHYNYVPTVTGPGHSSVYTGTTPRYHGVVGNSWYDRRLRRDVYCTDDSTVQLVGTAKGMGVSARNQVSTTLGDEMKMVTNGRSKVLALSLKDRASALPAGHMADGAFWFDSNTGDFISSTYYMPTLPKWVADFNAQKKADYYRQQTWTPLRGPEAYRNSVADSNAFERIFKGKTAATFPYELSKLAPLNPPAYEAVNISPFGNNLLTDLALAALAGTDLGRDEVPDLLALSYSSPDPVGHTFGPLSKEENDVYLRLDLEIARLLQALDKTVGKGNYTVFLTADHGASEVPKYLAQHQAPSGAQNHATLNKGAADFLVQQLGPGAWLETERNNMYYLNRSLIASRKLELARVQNLLADFLRGQPGIAQVNTTAQLLTSSTGAFLETKLQNGLYYQRFGDVRFELEPGWTWELGVGATHGSAYLYDSHVPLLWFGAGISPGISYEYHAITDIAPTAAMLVESKLPSACTGQPIVEVLSPGASSKKRRK